MTPEQQRIAIAEACGWKSVYIRGNAGPCGWLGELPTVERPHSPGSAPIPDYPNDLNAMHEAVAGLSVSERDCYRAHLSRIVSFDFHEAKTHWSHSICDATAAQRAKAFILTLNLRHK